MDKHLARMFKEIDKKALTRTKLSKMAGVSRPTLNKVLKGEGGRGSTEKVCNALGLKLTITVKK